MKGRIFRVDINNGVLVWQFIDDNGNVVGSRGISMGDDLKEKIMSMTLADMKSLNSKGIDLEENPSDEIGKALKMAYDEWQRAMKAELEALSGVIDLSE